MPNKFSHTSITRLSTCHPHLKQLMERAIRISPIDFSIISGYRNKREQDSLVDEGKSQLKYPKSKHNTYPSFAVDICPWVPGKGSVWDDDQLWEELAQHIFKVAHALQLEVEWGGDWKSFVDKPHWELK